MAVFRIHKTKDYTVLSNYHFRDKTLSLKSKGLLSLMLSLPDDWDYSVRGLATLSTDGVESTQSALQELEKHHYLKRTRILNHGKFGGFLYDVYEQPYDEDFPDEVSIDDSPNKNDSDNISPYTGNPYTGNPYTEKPYTGNPCTENPAQLNTNNINNLSTNYLDDVRDNNTNNDINEDVEWLRQLWNSRDEVTKARTLNTNTLRYDNCLKTINRYTHTELKEAYENIFCSEYLVKRKPTLDWFVNYESDTVGKLLENGYRDWKQPKQNGQFCNFEQRDYDYAALEKKLLGW